MKNKKAIFFTIIAVAILSLFLITYTSYSLVQNRNSIKRRINTLNNFVFSVEKDLPRQLYISGFRAIFLMEKRISEKGEYINDVNSSFQELFYNGTLYNDFQELIVGARFSDIEGSLSTEANKLNANLTITDPKIIMTQDDPWNVKISFSANLSIKDNSNLSSWNRFYQKDVYVSITNYEDPLYVIGTVGLAGNIINRTIYYPFVDGSDVTNLTKHLEGSYYINSTLAPNFLERLEGNLTPDPNGIESLVNLQELSNQGVQVKNKSCVDYIYFSEESPHSNQISGMPSWFRLDDNHLEIYNVSGLVI